MSTLPETMAAAVQAHQAGAFDQAIRLYETILATDPRHAEAWHLLGVACHQLGNNAAALQWLQGAIQLNASQSKYFYNLGVVLQAEGQSEQACTAYEQALALNPQESAARNNLANIAKDLGQFGRAEHQLRHLLTADSRWPGWLQRLGETLKMQGRVPEAIAVLRTELLLDPGNAQLHSKLLFALQYLPGISLASLAHEHKAWAARHEAPLAGLQTRFPHLDKNPDRPLRLGFLSPDLFYHPVSMFLAPLLERLNRNQFHVTCYASGGRRDALSERLARACSTWREVGDTPDDPLCHQIQADGIDILFDLAGHTDFNRLPVFVRKPAPLQISWAGYVGTTGLDAMDYLLADAYHVPESAEPFYSEQILRLPAGYIGYEPPSYAPEPAPLPLLTRGHATFGSLNNPTKFTTETVACWSEILRKVPGSVLLLKYKGCDELATAARLRAEFAQQGIDASRIDLRGNTTHIEHLQVYRELDLALDPFPYSGGITTCETVWMGVPVVTWPGETFASRHSLSHLTNAGCWETIAQDRDHYIRLAVDLANNPERLTELRASLRPRMAASPLCDAAGYAAAFEAQLRTVWRQWCQQG